MATRSVVQQFVIYLTIAFLSGCLIERPEFSKLEVMMEAESYIGTPYILGGQDYLGIDCSGLIVQSLSSVGVVSFQNTDGVSSDATADDIIKRNSYRVDEPTKGDYVGFFDSSGRYYHISIFDSFTAESIIVLDASTAGDGYVQYREIVNIESKPHLFFRHYGAL